MTEENRRLEHILVIMSFGFCVIIFVFLHQIDIAELNKKSKVKLATVIAMLLGLLTVVCYVRRRRRKLRGNTSYDPHRFTHFVLCYTNTKIRLLIAVLATPKSQPPFAFKKLNSDIDVLQFYLNFFTNLQPSKANS